MLRAIYCLTFLDLFSATVRPIYTHWKRMVWLSHWSQFEHLDCMADVAWTGQWFQKKNSHSPFHALFWQMPVKFGLFPSPGLYLIIKHPAMVLCWDLHIVGSKKGGVSLILGWEGITWCSISAGDCTPGWGLQIREPTEEGELSATGDWCLGPLGALRTAISPVMRTWIFWGSKREMDPNHLNGKWEDSNLLGCVTRAVST